MRIVSCVLLSFLVGCAAPADHPQIRALLGSQVEAWNRGDVEGFMAGYWKSEELTFATPDKMVRGWRATLERYKTKYATREQMGRLTFDRLTISSSAPDSAEVAGRFRLRRADGDRTGRFFLTLKKMDGEWAIVRDYTVEDSSASR